MDEDVVEPSAIDHLEPQLVADVEAASNGDVHAFERLVAAIQGRVWRYLIHLVGDAALAEDLTQEVLLRVHRRLHTLREPQKFVSWVLTAARNVAYDAWRAKRRRPLQLVGDRPLPDKGHGQDPHLGWEIHDAVAGLEEDIREAIVLVGMIGLTYKEAAETIGVPEGTVKSRVFRARQTLMQALRPEVSDE